MKANGANKDFFCVKFRVHPRSFNPALQRDPAGTLFASVHVPPLHCDLISLFDK
jgi:hypothetical protein